MFLRAWSIRIFIWGFSCGNSGFYGSLVESSFQRGLIGRGSQFYLCQNTQFILIFLPLLALTRSADAYYFFFKKRNALEKELACKLHFDKRNWEIANSNSLSDVILKLTPRSLMLQELKISYDDL
jgi:hypothetical protein